METEHLVIRTHNYVAGTTAKPEVKIFVQTKTRSRPLNDKRLKSGQTVWMKWIGSKEPIIATAKLDYSISGVIEDQDVSKVKELAIDTNLYYLDEYWESILEKCKKDKCYFTVIRLSDEEWLEELIYPNVRSYGGSWIYLDTEEKKKLWLSNTSPPDLSQPHQTKRASFSRSLPAESFSRSLPAGLRFDVLRRHNFTCVYCGRSAPKVELQIDHKIPWKIVKKHEVSNLVVACKECNFGKSDKII